MTLDQLKTRPVGRLLWEYSLPAVVGMLVMSLYNVVDRIIIGQVVGPDAIAGLAITFPVMNLSAAVGVLIGVGASARTSILLGQKRNDEANLVLGNALVMTVLNALVYLSLFAWFLDDILIAFGASQTTLPYARDFMQVILPGMLVMNISFSFNNVMRASGYPLKAMITMFIGAGLNILLVPIFVWHLKWGISGAAWATDIAMTVSAVFVMSHFFRQDANVRFRPGTFRLQSRIVFDMIAIGAAPSLVNFASCAINAILNRTLFVYGGDTSIATAGIFITYTSLLTTLIIGLCQGMQPILGYNYGAGCLYRLKSTYLIAVGWATAVCLVGCVGGWFLPHWIARAFSTDIPLISDVSNALPIAMSAFFVVGFQIISTSFFQSIGKAGKSILLSLTRQVIFLIPLLIILPKIYHLNGVWMSFATSDVFATIVTLILILIQFRQLSTSPHLSNQPL